MNARNALIALMMALGLTLAGCSDNDNQGPAEETGEQIDESMEEKGDEIEEATDEMGDEIDKMGDEVDEENNY
ncbi:hypothetical protein [Guyparkeria halopsychrophila]|uniref:hypothetical protein n=1 Tax=Guyparkeria halopsychrophila TaxID=3139421 RepID=UPI0037C79D8A